VSLRKRKKTSSFTAVFSLSDIPRSF